ncbi:MAG: protein Mom [Microcystis sp. M061S2]|nr:protein Mom [Microcystis sp. M061S2]
MKIDWATHEAAKYACENWHYSKCMPVNKLVKIGAWENNKFIGVVIFGCGASSHLGKKYSVLKMEICELVRVALTKHQTPVSRIIAIALKFLRKANPKLKLVVSFADPAQDHHGGVYQAGGWIYTGLSDQGGRYDYLINGKWTHSRSASEKFGRVGRWLIDTHKIQVRKPTRKHRYLFPLSNQMRAKIEPLRKPYPKRATSKDNGETKDNAFEA